MPFMTHRDFRTHRPKHPCPLCMAYAALAAIIGVIACMMLYEWVK